MDLVWQTLDNTSWGYLHCHGCKQAVNAGLLIDCQQDDSPAMRQREQRFWLRLCTDCLKKVEAIHMDNTPPTEYVVDEYVPIIYAGHPQAYVGHKVAGSTNAVICVTSGRTIAEAFYKAELIMEALKAKYETWPD